MSKDESSIPDEEWERFLREAAAGAPGAPEEPSARARMVTRRLREEKGEPPGWRTHQPVGRRTGKGWYLVGLLVAVALVVVALTPGRVAGWFGAGGDESTPLGAESVRPSAPPATEAAAERATLKRPFAGSPAQRWADGTAGISMPTARATGWMDKEQVAGALDSSRDFLEASSLDAGVLRGERPEKAISLINPQQRDVQDYLTAAFHSPGAENDPLMLFSRFPKAEVRLVGDVVKTRGRVTYEEGKRGALKVTADVTYVYPVVRAAAGSDEVTRVIARRETVLSWDDPEKVRTEPGTLSLDSYKLDATNGGCDEPDGYFHPVFRAQRPVAGSGDSSEVDPYDRSVSMDTRMRDSADAGCGTAARS
ncbi:hypothetical protein [Streptomyces tsukubensis]|uniref:Uncharacterized protein n=1 Tax=Streptomyces tsukubensis TaxID=83656 RepID=A0A1V4AG60_9ACTN|nr:hypothetical protein [Streptomyces tsukubensis]OON83009.1 hypothetical protein B1H18_01145 [Streptomyces tsukubensis]QFR92137.1 hypothetical protein GBW32_02540 [Streptomyces tsukubensis]